MTPGEQGRRSIHVVAAAVYDGAGRVLIAQRPVGKHLAGGWEFPGGKIEIGEGRVEALDRELHEELGITLTRHPRPLLRLRHAYPYGDVLLDMWVVHGYRGSPRGMDGQPIRWCTRAELETAAELLPADRPVVRALRLPDRLSATMADDYRIGELGAARTAEMNGRRDAIPLCGVWCGDAQEALIVASSKQADFLLLRRPLAAHALTTLCSAVDLPVFVPGSSLDEAWRLGASGIHSL